MVLSGELFNGTERSSSPIRSESSDDAGWHDDELELSPEEQKYKDMGYDSDTARKQVLKAHQDAAVQNESIGMGPGRTGVKGVIRDRDEAAGMERERKAKGVQDLREKMEAANLGGKTYLEEERDKAARGEDQFDELIFKELERDVSKRDVFGAPRPRFGYLREVGVKQFVKAVEQEERGVWVVVHIYDSVCFSLCPRIVLFTGRIISLSIVVTPSMNYFPHWPKIIQRRNSFVQRRLRWNLLCSINHHHQEDLDPARNKVADGETIVTTNSPATTTMRLEKMNLMTMISTLKCCQRYWFTVTANWCITGSVLTG